MQTPVFGERLRKQVEDRLKFYETGEKPKPNIDVMTEAVEEASTQVTFIFITVNCKVKFTEASFLIHFVR